MLHSIRAAVVVAIVGLAGCAGTVEEEQASAQVAEAAPQMCVTHAGSCALSPSRTSGSGCWCHFGYYTRTGFAR